MTWTMTSSFFNSQWTLSSEAQLAAMLACPLLGRQGDLFLAGKLLTDNMSFNTRSKPQVADDTANVLFQV